MAVEPLAVRLGATKGSFYWHFANREALIEAALARWERTGTEAVIAEVEAEPDPETRLRLLFAAVTRRAVDSPIEVSLPASAGHPGVAAVLRRVAERRISYVEGLFLELGFPPELAHARALLAYTSYLGRAQLSHAVPQVLPDGDEQTAYQLAVTEVLLRRD